MSITRRVIFALALIGLFASASTALADHCTTKTALYGRSSLAPTAPPPYSRSTSGMCPSMGETFVVGDHTLPLGSDQIMIRINGDFGPSRPVMRVDLDGLGFVSNTFFLERAESLAGGQAYQLTEWLTIPSPTPGATVTATAHYPDGPVTISYRLAQGPI